MDNVLPTYHAEVLEVHSGDDLVLLVSLGIDNLYKKVRVRLQGVDTPDAYKAGPDTKAGILRSRLVKMLKGKSCIIQTHSQSSSKGGWVVSLHVDPSMRTETLNEILRQEGYVFRSPPNAT